MTQLSLPYMHVTTGHTRAFMSLTFVVSFILLQFHICFISAPVLIPLSRAVLFPWWVPRSGMGSLLNFGLCLEPCHLRFFPNLRLLFLAVLESGAPLSSPLEEALYKCLV